MIHDMNIFEEYAVEEKTRLAFETPGQSCPYCRAPKGIAYCKKRGCMFATANREEEE